MVNSTYEMDDGDVMAARMHTIWERYRVQVLADIDAIASCGRHLDAGRCDDAMLLAARADCHNLIGTAGLFGFADATVRCRELYERLRAAPEIAERGAIVKLALALRQQFDVSSIHRQSTNRA